MNMPRIKTNTVSSNANWSDAHITKIDSTRVDERKYWLSSGDIAYQAAGCLLQPEEGDLVLLYRSESGDNFITQVLYKQQHEKAYLGVNKVKHLLINQPDLSFMAQNNIRLTALKDIDATAISGNLHLQAENLFSSIKETVVEQARHRISKAFTYALDVTGLLRMHSEQGVITAEKDLKVDAERISMG